MANPVPPHETNVLAPACPRCSAPNARWLEFTSLTSKTDSFQCLACGHTWMEPVEANSAQLKKACKYWMTPDLPPYLIHHPRG
jgi:hypothetical protein